MTEPRICRTLVAIAAFAALGSGSAFASCGPNATRTYGDITAIRYARTACFGHCPNYEVLVSQQGFYYVGKSDVSKHGTYKAPLGNTLARVRKTLEAHRFFKLVVPHIAVMDVPHLILSVERCGLATRLDFPQLDEREGVTRLFDALDAIVAHAAWRKTSDSVESPLPRLAPFAR